MTAPQLYGACRHAHHRLPGGNVARHDRAGTGLRSGSNRDGSAKSGIDPDERARTDHGGVLVDAVEVGGHRPGADVHVLPHLGVAQVAEMVLLGARADLRLLELREVADPAARTDAAARPQVAVRTDLDVLGDLRLFDD